MDKLRDTGRRVHNWQADIAWTAKPSTARSDWAFVAMEWLTMAVLVAVAAAAETVGEEKVEPARPPSSIRSSS